MVVVWCVPWGLFSVPKWLLRKVREDELAAAYNPECTHAAFPGTKVSEADNPPHPANVLIEGLDRPVARPNKGIVTEAAILN
jgi:hypothetical protein